MRIGIITGASSGIGKWFTVFAPYYFKDLDEIWLIGRDLTKLSNVSEKLNIPYRIMQMDLTKEDNYKSFQEILNITRPEIRLLVNCAGNGMIGPFYMIKEQDHVDTIRLNCEALTKMTRICLPNMVYGSHIINVASASAFMPQPDFAVYAASKSFVLRLSYALSQELKKRGIVVTAVCPGAINTPFFDHAQKYQKRKEYKKYFMYNGRKVVLQAYNDALKGKKISVHGFLMKVLAIAGKLLPYELFMKFC